MEEQKSVKRIAAPIRLSRVWIIALVFIAALAVLTAFFIIRRGRLRSEGGTEEALITPSPEPETTTGGDTSDETPGASEPDATQPPSQGFTKTAVVIDGKTTVVLASRQAAEELLLNVERHFLSIGNMPAEVVTELSTEIELIPAAEDEQPTSYDEAFAYLVGSDTPIRYQSRAIYSNEVPITHGTERVLDENLPEGCRIIEVYGRDGIERQTHSATYLNGQMISDIITETFVVMPPVSGKIRIGAFVPGEDFVLAPDFGETPFITNEISFVVPAEGSIVRLFGPSEGSFHQGLDIAAEGDKAVRAAADGTVVSVMERGAYGLLIEIEHMNGVCTRYARLRDVSVNVGDAVSAGDVIAYAAEGDTGTILHFELRINGIAYNPLKVLNDLSSRV